MNRCPKVRLRIGGIPTRADLKMLSGAGIQQLINVSGVGLGQIYADDALDTFTLNEFFFSDVFSEGRTLNPAILEIMSAAAFCEAMSETMRAEFIAAVQVVGDCLCGEKAIYLFCHRGVGRSPAVAVAALVYAMHVAVSDAIAMVMQVRGCAEITEMTLSSVSYALEALPAS